MQTSSNRELIPVLKGELLTLGQSAPVEIGCESGAVWITQDNDVRDVVLHAGERFVSDGAGTVLVYALKPTVMTAKSLTRRATESFWKSLGDRLLAASYGRRIAFN